MGLYRSLVVQRGRMADLNRHTHLESRSQRYSVRRLAIAEGKVGQPGGGDNGIAESHPPQKN